jgi:hypothetical protein
MTNGQYASVPAASRRAALALLLAAAVFAIYWQAIFAYYLDDDFQWLVTRWSFHPSMLLDISGQSHFYRPVIELYFWIGSPLFGGSPIAFHIASIVLHLANCGLLYLLVSALGLRRGYAYVAALLFAVQPGYVGAVAWVGAIAEPIGAFFGCLSILALIQYRRAGRRSWIVGSVAAFALSLLTHESSVVFLPLLVLADWVCAAAQPDLRQAQVTAYMRSHARAFVPFVIVTLGYLAIDLAINTRNYIVVEGQYRIGWHMVNSVFGYIASLYVGERTWLAHTFVGLVLLLVLIRGKWRARYGVAWMVIAIMPFAPFEFGNVSRYLYLPAMGFAMVMAEGASALDAWMRGRWQSAARVAVLSVLIAFTAIRFGHFARRGVTDITARMEAYRTFLTELRRTHPTLDNLAVVPVDAALEKEMPLRFLEAAVQWEYKNPTITLTIR